MKNYIIKTTMKTSITTTTITKKNYNHNKSITHNRKNNQKNHENQNQYNNNIKYKNKSNKKLNRL